VAVPSGRESDGGGFLGRASGGDPGGKLRWRAEAGDRRRRSYGGWASNNGAPKPDERRRRTLGLVVTAVVRAAVGFGSNDDRSWRSACGGES
jgi:hypothetical protein